MDNTLSKRLLNKVTFCHESNPVSTSRNVLTVSLLCSKKCIMILLSI